MTTANDKTSSERENLRIGLPSKGRLSELAGDLLRQAGLRFRRQDRGLFARVSGLPIDLTFLRTDDIPTLCAEGAIDMGITGSDVVAEADVGPARELLGAAPAAGDAPWRCTACDAPGDPGYDACWNCGRSRA